MGTFSKRLLINTDIMGKVHIKMGYLEWKGSKLPLKNPVLWSTRFIVSAWPVLYGCPEVSKSCGVTLPLPKGPCAHLISDRVSFGHPWARFSPSVA